MYTSAHSTPQVHTLQWLPLHLKPSQTQSWACRALKGRAQKAPPQLRAHSSPCSPDGSHTCLLPTALTCPPEPPAGPGLCSSVPPTPTPTPGAGGGRGGHLLASPAAHHSPRSILLTSLLSTYHPLKLPCSSVCLLLRSLPHPGPELQERRELVCLSHCCISSSSNSAGIY